MSNLPKFDYEARDKSHWEVLEQLFENGNHTIPNILMDWPAYVKRRNISRFLGHYELFKKVIDLPGSIVELGVFKGASFFTWAKLLETFCPADRQRKVFGFDHFEGLKPEQFCESDGAIDQSVDKVPGGYASIAEDIRTLVELHNADNLLPGKERCRLVEGDVFESIPKFLDENPGLSISLLHFDVDLYEPTKFGLEMLYPLVVPGGVICFDEYGEMPWQGETNAVNEYFETLPKDERPVIRKFPFSARPAGFVVK